MLKTRKKMNGGNRYINHAQIVNPHSAKTTNWKKNPNTKKWLHPDNIVTPRTNKTADMSLPFEQMTPKNAEKTIPNSIIANNDKPQTNILPLAPTTESVNNVKLGNNNTKAQTNILPLTPTTESVNNVKLGNNNTKPQTNILPLTPTTETVNNVKLGNNNTKPQTNILPLAPTAESVNNVKLGNTKELNENNNYRIKPGAKNNENEQLEKIVKNQSQNSDHGEKNLLQIFDMIDVNKDGVLTRAEIIKGLKHQEVRNLFGIGNISNYNTQNNFRRDFEQIFQNMNVDNDRQITREEFLKYFKNKINTPPVNTNNNSNNSHNNKSNYKNTKNKKSIRNNYNIKNNNNKSKKNNCNTITGYLNKLEEHIKKKGRIDEKWLNSTKKGINLSQMKRILNLIDSLKNNA